MRMVRREPLRAVFLFELAHANRTAIAEQLAEQPPAYRPSADHGHRVWLHPACIEMPHGLAVIIQHKDRGVRCPHDPARGVTEARQQIERIALCGQLLAQLDQRRQPFIHSRKLLSAVRELVREQPKMLWIKLFRWEWSCRSADTQRRVYHSQNFLRFCGLEYRVSDAARFSQQPGLTVEIVGSAKDYRNVGGTRVSA